MAHTPKLDHSCSKPVIGLWVKESKRFFSLLAHTKPTVSIGRARKTDIQLGRYASMKHCEIECREDGTFVLQDLQSTNGTWVNGIRVSKALTLQPGMYIKAGTSEFVVLDERKRIPLTAKGVTSLLTRASEYYGSDRKAASGTGKSAATVRRARHRKQKKDKNN